MVLALQSFQPAYEPLFPQLLGPYRHQLFMLDLLQLSSCIALVAALAILLCDYGFYWYRYRQLPDHLRDLASIRIALSDRYRVAVLIFVGLWSVIFFGSLM